MPKVRTKKKKVPKGFEIIEPKLEEFARKMQEVEVEQDEYKTRSEALWPILRLNNQRSRYIYDLYYVSKSISREVYEYCLEEKYADKALIAKWKKQGYESLCCTKCVAMDTNFGTTCICRVPPQDLPEGKIVECKNCGCRGCYSH